MIQSKKNNKKGSSEKGFFLSILKQKPGKKTGSAAEAPEYEKDKRPAGAYDPQSLI
jgi:hypothetical protein